jgi:predicted peptidase
VRFCVCYGQTIAHPNPATGTDPVKTLTQGLGAVIWASEEDQAKHPSFVLAPQYTGDNSSTSGSSDVVNTIALIQQLMQQYNIDASRIYTTGQSAGAISSFQMLIDYPDMFAGAMLVAGQADSAYTDKLADLADDNIWMICSAGDERAYPDMTAIKDAVEVAGTSVTVSNWGATLPADEQNSNVSAMAANGTHINWAVLNDGTVIPAGVTDSAVTEHLNTWRVAYSISGIRDWLFEQVKK